ncbi:iron-containing redox enzyme family protein [Brachybacterium endophyticum]|uniref:Iron-containing redox enzyme family protein n=1 Tax=Brachybacterium endophyticum TaxID=2182385 RepID=A0A2U2RKT1_9MICO|nr:iron-containing redox enzyme family protein [Brachybacterium endophyticum]PWH06489.1 iron-containing redox enzyme family protein [Brachybacterium endophyticum]
MLIPSARGSLSGVLADALRSGNPRDVENAPAPDSAEDSQIALWILYALHHQGFDDAVDDLEWAPALISLRREIEHAYEQELRDRQPEIPRPGRFAEDFFAFIAGHDGPSLVGRLRSSATAEQMQQFLRHKSIYSLKESDHTMWTVPRLSHRVKAAVVELQYDEYGAGDPHRLHAHLFARGLEASGLSAAYGAYIDEAPLEILEQDNAMSMFGLNRRLRAASLGFLAAFEATSSAPCRKIAGGLARLGFPPQMAAYYTEHVEADAVHEQLAVRNICEPLLQESPDHYPNIYFGAWTCLHVEDRYATRMLEEWS